MIQVEDSDMSRVCDLTGKRRLVGNKVSHANNKTKMTQTFQTNTGTGQLFHSLYVLCKQVQRIHESSSSLQKMWYFGLRYVFQRETLD